MVHLITINLWTVENIDATIVAEEPKMSPYIPEMEKKIRQHIPGSPPVSVKATTTEQMGFTGRKEGIAAMAVALISKTEEDRHV